MAFYKFSVTGEVTTAAILGAVVGAVIAKNT